MLTVSLTAQTAPDSAELTRLLKEFLAGASRNDAAIHDRFWADDLIYTGSTGRRRGKAELMRDVRSAPAPKPGDPTSAYTAEDIRIQQYGNTAIVAFRLVGTTEKDGKKEIMNFLNSGTFLKRAGKWQVVNWQATRMPRPEEESNKEVAAAEHVTWVRDSLMQMLKAKPGMTRADLLKVFRTEGGLSTGLNRTYVYRECPYFKIDVEFEAVGRPARDNEGRVTLVESDADLIKVISRPYLQFSVTD
jgi:hypothetical protein